MPHLWFPPSLIMAVMCIVLPCALRFAATGSDCIIEDCVIMGGDYYEHEKTWKRQVLGLGTIAPQIVCKI
jgi:hypothetical protein